MVSNEDINVTLSNIILIFLFVNDEPVTKNFIKSNINLFQITNDDIQNAIQEIETKLIDTPFVLLQTEDSYKIGVKKEYQFIFNILKNKPIKLSDTTLETLAIIIHKQPVSRQEIEQIRKVDCEKALETLLKAKLIKPICSLKKQGTPLLYSITDECLFRFGFKKYSELLDFINTHLSYSI